MKKLNKIISALLCIIMFAGCAGNDKRNYNVIVDPEDKIILSDQLYSRVSPPSMDLNLRFAELVVDGNVTSTKEVTLSTGDMYSKEEIAQGMPNEITYTFSVFKVKETIRGDIDGKEVVNGEEIYVLLDYRMTKPNDGENLILFINSRFREGCLFFIPIDYEHSIFTYEDKTEKLYSFSNSKELSSFDSKKKSELYEVVRNSKDFFIEGNLYRVDKVN
ncbi:MAG: hypothetical protein FWG44_00855 [Oscillospiraceae bacterium]|nr:hypothetical protein [Oscillospiraceae bacterium]